jgi:transposase
VFWIPAHLTFYLYVPSADMRKSFDGLGGLVISELGQNPLSGDVYVFLNKPRNRIKLLLWDGDGFWLFYKRLEKGTFQLPANCSRSTSTVLAYDELLMIIKGIDLNSIKRRPRFHRHALSA